MRQLAAVLVQGDIGADGQQEEERREDVASIAAAILTRSISLSRHINWKMASDVCDENRKFETGLCSFENRSAPSLFRKMSISADINALVEQWIAWDPNSVSKAEISALRSACSEQELRQRLGSRIAFGTAGTLV